MTTLNISSKTAQMCWRMLISRADPMAGAFGGLAVCLRTARCSR